MTALRTPRQLYRVAIMHLGNMIGNMNGSVAAEFALIAPVLVLLAAGVADFGLLADKSAGMAATVRIGAEFARIHPDDTSGIQNAMRSAMNFVPPLVFPGNFPRRCECDDGTPIACRESCATVGRPSPNRVFIRITANQSFTPIVAWPGIPTLVTGTTEIRLQ